MMGEIGFFRRSGMLRLILPNNVILAGVLGWLSCGSGNADPKFIATRYLPERRVPDLTQNDPKGGFMDGGKAYCGPVAVSNSLMAMFGDDLEWDGMNQYDLVNQLASVGYMNTHRKHGTHLNQFLRGVQRFVRERGVAEFSLRFQGFRRHEREFGPGLRRPQLKWIQSYLAAGGAVWLMVGWYTFDSETMEFERIGGHWVTAVGFGEDAFGRPDPDILIIHDPAPVAGPRPAREFVKMTPLTEGTLVLEVEHRVFPAKGIYQLEGGMHVKSSADHALLDGVVGLHLTGKAKTGTADAEGDCWNGEGG